MDTLSTIVLIVALGAIAVVIGLARREPRVEIALSVSGGVLSSLGLFWAVSISREAFLAVGTATLGVILFMMADSRGRERRRRADEEPEARAELDGLTNSRGTSPPQ